MAVFAYSGINEQRLPTKGTVAAETPRQARDLLRARGVRVQDLKPCASAQRVGLFSRLMMARARQQWATSVHELAMLLHAGIPLLEAIDTIAMQSRGSFRMAMLNLRDRVAAGSSLAEAMSLQSELFDAASIHLVEVGENSGTLEHVLTTLAEFKQRMQQVKDEVFTALMYPVFLIVFGTAAALFLMTSVMPPLLENLQETLDTLPWPTQIVKAFSDLLMTYGWLLALIAITGLVSLTLVMRTDAGRRLFHRWFLRLPIIGPMAVKQGVSRIAMIVGTLTRSGVVLTKAVDLAAKSTNNLVLRDALQECGDRIGAGEEVATALERSNVFPPLAVRVFSVGQESGKLDEMLLRLSDDYERQLATSSARLTALLEPILILFLAVFVGFLLLATILPILEAGNVMS
ncbi:MAG: type II secretion system F family protein [Pirellulaceae bacterium]|nr:type II secretion system F family protein [Pirellulaceae bacterium]